MGRRFCVGDDVKWSYRFSRKGDKITRRGKIESVGEEIMFIWEKNGGHWSAKKVGGRWLAFKPSYDYQCRISRAA